MMQQAATTMADHGAGQLTEAIGRLQVHDHLCLIYETREEQFAATVPFIRLGLERGGEMSLHCRRQHRCGCPGRLGGRRDRYHGGPAVRGPLGSR